MFLPGKSEIRHRAEEKFSSEVVNLAVTLVLHLKLYSGLKIENQYVVVWIFCGKVKHSVNSFNKLY